MSNVLVIDELEDEGSWTRRNMLDMRARTTATNNTDNEYIVHFWHLDFTVLISFFTDSGHGSVSTPFEVTTTFESRGGNVANVSSLDESGCDR